MKRMHLVRLVAAAALALNATAWALDTGKTAQGWAYVSGGVGSDELHALHARRDQFSLWVVTAARPSGAYLADVRVQVIDAQHAVVFDQRLAGPWLFIELPPGRYEIQATHKSETQTKVTTIHPGDHHQVLFYFDVAAQVLPPASKAASGG